MLVVSRFVRLGGFPSLSFFLFALAHFRSLPLAWWSCISALRGFSYSSVAVILFLLMKYVFRHVREKSRPGTQKTHLHAWFTVPRVDRGIACSWHLCPTRSYIPTAWLLHGCVYMQISRCSRVLKSVTEKQQTTECPFENMAKLLLCLWRNSVSDPL